MAVRKSDKTKTGNLSEIQMDLFGAMLQQPDLAAQVVQPTATTVTSAPVNASKISDGLNDDGRIIAPEFYSAGLYPWQAGYDQQSARSTIAVSGQDLLQWADKYPAAGRHLRDAIRHAEIKGDAVPQEAYERLAQLAYDYSAPAVEEIPPALANGARFYGADLRLASEIERLLSQKAKPEVDLQKRRTGWKRLEVENGWGVILVSDDGKYAAAFVPSNLRSGTDSLRAYHRAAAFAIDHPYTYDAPQGELVVTPMFSSPTSVDTTEQAGVPGLAAKEVDQIFDRLTTDFTLYPVHIMEAMIASGEITKLYGEARVATAGAFGELARDRQAAAYALYVTKGGTEVAVPEGSYNDWVRTKYREMDSRRLQTESVVSQASGQPFGSEEDARQFQAEFDLADTHQVSATEQGFVLKRLAPAYRPSAIAAYEARLAEDPDYQRQQVAFAKAALLGDASQELLTQYENGDLEIEQFEAGLERIEKRAGAAGAVGEAAPEAVPQAGDEELSKFLMVAANSIDELRKVDVLRVLESNGLRRDEIAGFIVRHRADLVQEVTEIMRDEFGIADWAPGATPVGQDNPVVQQENAGASPTAQNQVEQTAIETMVASAEVGVLNDSQTGEPSVVETAEVDLLRAAIEAQARFQAATADAEAANLTGEQYAALLDAELATEARLIEKLASRSDDGFALRGATKDGRLCLLNSSAQRENFWQLTRFDANGQPFGDSQYASKAQAIKEFLQEINLATLNDYDNSLGVTSQQIPEAAQMGEDGQDAVKPIAVGVSQEQAASESPTDGEPVANEGGTTSGDKELSAEEKIRAAFNAIPNSVIGEAYPVTVVHNGVTRDFLATIKKAGGNRLSVLHLVNIKLGRMLRGEPLQYVGNLYKISQDNVLSVEGMPFKPSEDLIKQWHESGFSLPALPVEMGAAVSNEVEAPIAQIESDQAMEEGAPEDWDASGQAPDQQREEEGIEASPAEDGQEEVYAGRVETTEIDADENQSLFALEEEGNTEDAGDELSYNKRNRIRRALNWDDLKDMDTALRVKEAVKAKIYPKPDYQALIDGGMYPVIAHIVKQCYDAIAVQPQTSAAPTDEQIQRYINAVNTYMGGVMKWANDPGLTTAWLGEVGDKAAARHAAYSGIAVPIANLAPVAKKTLLETVYPDGWRESRDDLRLINGRDPLGALQPSTDEAIKAIKEIEKGWPQSLEAWQKQGYRVVRGDDLTAEFYESPKAHGRDKYVTAWLSLKEPRRTNSIETIRFEGVDSKDDPSVQEAVQKRIADLQGRFLLLNKRNALKAVFGSEDEARQAARELVKRGPGSGIKEEGISVESAERVGKAHRQQSENISSERFLETFGFRGINFGNWMKGKSNEKERQLHLNHAFDSFMDLADVLDLPPKAMSLNGVLGIAFGAQGNGKAAAHFVPGKNEINITRTAGAGAVAHEWGHALDHYMARLAGLEREQTPYLSEFATKGAELKRFEWIDGKYVSVTKNRFSDAIPAEIVLAVANISTAMNKRDLSDQEKRDQVNASLDSSVKRMLSWIPAIRREFERVSGLSDEGKEKLLGSFDGLAEKVKNLQFGEGKSSVGKNTYISPVVEQIRELYKEAAGRVPSLEHTKGLQGNIDHVRYLLKEKAEKEMNPGLASQEPRQTTQTTYAANAWKLDKDKGGKPYWSTECEKFARAFDAFVWDRTEESGVRNTYLSGLNSDERTSPKGDERKAINRAFRKFFRTLEPALLATGTDFVRAQSLSDLDDGLVEAAPEGVLGDALVGEQMDAVAMKEEGGGEPDTAGDISETSQSMQQESAGEVAERALPATDARSHDFPGYTKKADGNWVANRAVYYPNLSVNGLNTLLSRVEPSSEDAERLKDYKWVLLFDHQTAMEKGFLIESAADGGYVTAPANKFWLANIDERIKAAGGDPDDLTNNPLAIQQTTENAMASLARQETMAGSLDVEEASSAPVIAEAAASAIVFRNEQEARTFLGARVRYVAQDIGDPLSAGIVEGVLVDAANTSGGNIRYRIRTDKPSPSGSGNIEKLVYSHQGTISLVPAKTLDVGDMPVGVFETAPIQAPIDWVVMNAPRPLLGTLTSQNGEAWRGRMFYAAIDPNDPMAESYVAENKKLAAYMVLVANREEQVAMAVEHSEYRDRYYEMALDERYEAAASLVIDLNKNTYAESVALLEEARSRLKSIANNADTPAATVDAKNGLSGGQDATAYLAQFPSGEETEVRVIKNLSGFGVAMIDLDSNQVVGGWRMFSGESGQEQAMSYAKDLADRSLAVNQEPVADKAAQAAQPPQSEKSAPAAIEPPKVVSVPREVDAALTEGLEKQKDRIVRLLWESKRDGKTLEQKTKALARLQEAESKLTKMRKSRFDAEDAAIEALNSGSLEAFSGYETLYPDAYNTIQNLVGGSPKAELTEAALTLAAMASQHRLDATDLQGFVESTLRRWVFDGEQLSELFAPLELGWKERIKAEEALLQVLIPHLKQSAEGREISGLAIYEEQRTNSEEIADPGQNQTESEGVEQRYKEVPFKGGDRIRFVPKPAKVESIGYRAEGVEGVVESATRTVSGDYRIKIKADGRAAGAKGGSVHVVYQNDGSITRIEPDLTAKNAGLTALERFEARRRAGTDTPLWNTVDALVAVAGRVTDTRLSFTNRWQSQIGFTELAERSGQEILKWMEDGLVKAPWQPGAIPGARYEKTYPGAGVLYWEAALADFEKHSPSFQEAMHLNEERVRDVEELGGNPETIAAARNAVGQMLRAASQNRDGLEQGLKQAQQQQAEEEASLAAEEAKKYAPVDLANVGELAKKPTAASITGWKAAEYNGQEVWGNGHIVDLSGVPHLAGWENRKDPIGYATTPNAAKLCHPAKGKKLEPFGTYSGNRAYGDGGVVFFEVADNLVVLDKNYVRYFLSKYPGAEFYVPTQPYRDGTSETVIEGSVVEVFKGDERLGLVMPFRASATQASIAELKQKCGVPSIEAGAPSATPAVELAPRAEPTASRQIEVLDGDGQPERRDRSVVLIEAGRMAEFRKRLNSLNDKAATFGLSPITVLSADEVVYERRKQYADRNQEILLVSLVPARQGAVPNDPVKLVRMEIEYPEIKLGNWRVVGKLEALASSNLSFSVSRDPADVAAVVNYAEHPIECEHCNVKRKRNDGFVLKDVSTGQYKQVGSSCLEDFTGIDPGAALFLARMHDVVKVVEGELDDFVRSGRPNVIGTEQFLANVAFLCENGGFVSASMARDRGWRPTYESAQFIDSVLRGDAALIEKYEAKRADYLAMAETVRQWVANKPQQTDFDRNVKLLLAEDTINLDRKHLAFAAATVPMYRRSMEAANANDASSTISQHIGKPGEKMSAKLTVERVIKMDNPYTGGVTDLVLMRDQEGNRVTWKTGAAPFEISNGEKAGQTMEAEFKVKQHDEYRGVSQTKVSHLKVLAWLQAAPAPAAEAAEETGADESLSEVLESSESDAVDPIAFEHNGFRIYPQMLSGELKWLVQQPENRGTDRQFGDTIHATVEAAKEQADRDFQHQQWRKEVDEREQIAAEAAAAKVEANRGKTIAERRRDDILDKPTTLPPSAGVGRTTRREAMRLAVEQGRAIVEVQVVDAAAKRRDQAVIEKVQKAGYLLGLSNENIPLVKSGLEAKKRLAENNYTKPEYRLYMGRDQDSAFFEISKTEYEFAQSLIQAAATASQEAPDNALKSPDEAVAEMNSQAPELEDERLKKNTNSTVLGQPLGLDSDSAVRVSVGVAGEAVAAPAEIDELSSETARRATFRLPEGPEVSVIEGAERGEFFVTIGNASYGKFSMDDSARVSRIKPWKHFLMDDVARAADLFATIYKQEAEAKAAPESAANRPANPVAKSNPRILPEESDQERSYREWTENYDRVSITDDLSTISTVDLERALSWASRRSQGEKRKGWDGGEVNRNIVLALDSELERLGVELRKRRGEKEDAWVDPWPAKRLDEVFHIGSLNVEDKGLRGDSLEGNGLSVSRHPDAWVSIAKLGGFPKWVLTTEEGRFLDVHQLSKDQRGAVNEWAKENGLLKDEVRFEARWYDEVGEEVRSFFSSKQEAIDNAYGDESAVTEVMTPVATEKLHEKLGLSSIHDVVAQDMALICWAQKKTEFDGLWWDDELDVAAYSAPRGVIFPDKLEKWHVEPYDNKPDPSPDGPRDRDDPSEDVHAEMSCRDDVPDSPRKQGPRTEMQRQDAPIDEVGSQEFPAEGGAEFPSSAEFVDQSGIEKAERKAAAAFATHLRQTGDEEAAEERAIDAAIEALLEAGLRGIHTLAAKANGESLPLVMARGQRWSESAGSYDNGDYVRALFLNETDAKPALLFLDDLSDWATAISRQAIADMKLAEDSKNQELEQAAVSSEQDEEYQAVDVRHVEGERPDLANEDDREIGAGFVAPRFKEDIPSNTYIKDKLSQVEDRGRNEWGVPRFFGPITGVFDRPLLLPVSLLASLPGERGEQHRVRQDSLAYIRENWERVGKITVYVEVDPYGKAWVSEGNHRLMVAAERKADAFLAEVRYFTGAQRVASEFSPEMLISLDRQEHERSEQLVLRKEGVLTTGDEVDSRSEQFARYEKYIAENGSTPGMLEVIQVDERLLDGEPEILIAMAGDKNAVNAVGAVEEANQNALPEGWVESAPGKMATNKDPVAGGIIDQQIVNKKWFFVPNNDSLATTEGFETRAEAFAALQVAINELVGPEVSAQIKGDDGDLQRQIANVPNVTPQSKDWPLEEKPKEEAQESSAGNISETAATGAHMELGVPQYETEKQEAEPSERKSAVVVDLFGHPIGKASTAPEHKANAGVPLNPERKYVRTGLGPITELAPIDESLVPPHLSPEELRETVNEWAAIMADPEAPVRIAKKAGQYMSKEDAQKTIEGWKTRAVELRQKYGGQNFDKTVLSLFDLSGEWSRPWEEAGYNVIRFDIQSGQDINDFSVEYFNENYDFGEVYAILAACPCTDFAVSGARHFAEKDADGRTEASKDLVFQTLRTIEYFRPTVWAIENPVGRIEKLTGLPHWRMSFDPHHFGEDYTKKTLIWGNFNADLPTANVEPTEGSKMWAKYGGKSQATKNARSVTPEGFAYAFFVANNYHDMPVVKKLVAQYPEAAGAIKQALSAGVTEQRIHDLMYDTYGNYEYYEARNALVREISLVSTGPVGQYEEVKGLGTGAVEVNFQQNRTWAHEEGGQLIDDNYQLEGRQGGGTLSTTEVSGTDPVTNPEYGPIGNRNSEQMDAGVAIASDEFDRSWGIHGGTSASGDAGEGSLVEAGVQSYGEARNHPGIRPEPGAAEYVVDPTALAKRTLGQRVRDNVDAIRTLKRLEAEEGLRNASAQDRDTLAKYSGWGALGGVFDPSNRQWKTQGEELRAVLTDDEFRAARKSTLDAYFTDPAVVGAMYSALEQIGFGGGRILEPSLGMGVFFGSMPREMRKNSSLYGVELDDLTSRMVSHLYPEASIAKRRGFEEYDVPSEYFDMVIGNPPYGSHILIDSQRSEYSGSRIHNYFLCKGIDKLRPGGVMEVVVTHSFMDSLDNSAREWVSRNAKLIGAVRLPNTAFKGNAGTEVVSDILLFQKREQDDFSEGLDWLEVVDQANVNPSTGETVVHKVNKLFVTHPELVLGDPTASGKMYTGNSYTVSANGDLVGQLQNWVSDLPRNIYRHFERHSNGLDHKAIVPEGVKIGGFYVADDGKVMQRAEDQLGEKTARQWTPKNKKDVDRMKGMIQLRDALRSQMALERSDISTAEEIEESRVALNKSYETYVKQYGYLNSQSNRRVFLDDTEAQLLMALEFDYDKGVSKEVAESKGLDPRPATAKKADILKQRVLFPYHDGHMNVFSAKDALLASLNHRGKVDVDYMSDVYGKATSEILEELGDLVYQEPNGKIVTSDEYLSGDVKTKLDEAKKAASVDPRLARNVEALEGVIPKDKKPSEIMVGIGAPFVPPEIYEEFVEHISGGSAKVAFVKGIGRWVVHFTGNTDQARNSVKFGTTRLSAQALFELTMLGRGAVVKETVEVAGERITRVLEQETQAARDKQNLILAEWQSWIWADGGRASKVIEIYNATMNRTVNRKFDGTHLTLPGMNPGIKLLDHQKNAVWRGLQARQVLLDHVVGAGKTFVMASMAMEMRRLGIARKPMFVVPNHLTLQWRGEFIRLYPGSNVLAASPEDFTKENRKRLFSKIVTGDWDAVIIGHSSIKKIALPEETETQVLKEEVDEVSLAIEEMKRERGDRNIIRDMEGIRARLEAKIKDKLNSIGKRDDVVSFDELGVDALFVDEMHEFKNLMYKSTMDRNPGMGNPAGSAKSFDLFVKIRWLLNKFGETANLITATGTPVSNSLVEMFNMQRYMQYPTLKKNGLHVFDAWAKQFGQVENVYEVAPSGTGYRQSTRFAKFANLPALMGLYRSFADTVTLKDLEEQEKALGRVFPVPKIKGGKPLNVVAPRSETVSQFMGVPEAETDEMGRVKFELGLDEPLIIQPGQDNKYHVMRGEDVIAHLDSEQAARFWVVEKALTPRITVDPQSILGKFGRLRDLSKQTNGKVNALSLTSEANKAALDFRMIDPSAEDFEESKVNRAVKSMVEHYKLWSGDRGTQLVFCDLSVPASARKQFAIKEHRLYVRSDSGEIQMKRGTLTAIEGHEDYPFFIVKRGKGDSQRFDAYDAMSGVWVLENISRSATRDAVQACLEDDEKRKVWARIREEAGPIEQEDIDEYNNENEVEVEGADYFSKEDIFGVAGSTTFSVYDDIKRKLMESGVPEREIAFIHDYSTPAAKDKLFRAVNAGAIRFLMGSTQKMGAGTCVQERLVALHHIDAPWRPSDLEQREGRIKRRGNALYERDPENFEIFIGRYATEQTYDTRRWQIVEHKARGIEQLRNFDGSFNEIEDVDGQAASASDMKAAASGDPLILEETKLRNEIKRLQQLERHHADEKLMIVHRIQSIEKYITDIGPKKLQELDDLIELLAKTETTQKIENQILVGGRAHPDRKSLINAIENEVGVVRIGLRRNGGLTFRGIEIRINGITARQNGVEIVAPGAYLGSWVDGADFSGAGFLQRLANYANNLPNARQQVATDVDERIEELTALREQAMTGFAHAADLEKARDEHRKVQRALLSKGPNVPEWQKPFVEAAIKQQKQRLEDLGFGQDAAAYFGSDLAKPNTLDGAQGDGLTSSAASVSAPQEVVYEQASSTKAVTPVRPQAELAGAMGLNQLGETEPELDARKRDELSQNQEFGDIQDRIGLAIGDILENEGASSSIIETSEGKLLRVGIGPLPEVINSQHILQPEEQGSLGNIYYQFFPMPETTGILEQDAVQLAKELVKEGLQFQNPTADKVGRIDGRIVVIHHDSLSKSDCYSALGNNVVVQSEPSSERYLSSYKMIAKPEGGCRVAKAAETEQTETQRPEEERAGPRKVSIPAWRPRATDKRKIAEDMARAIRPRDGKLREEPTERNLGGGLQAAYRESWATGQLSEDPECLQFFRYARSRSAVAEKLRESFASQADTTKSPLDLEETGRHTPAPKNK